MTDKHRDVSEVVFGLMLAGKLDPEIVDASKFVYPYSKAIEPLKKGKNAADLSIRFSHDAITAAIRAAESVDGIDPETWATLLNERYETFMLERLYAGQLNKMATGEDPDLDRAIALLDKMKERKSQNHEPITGSDVLALLGTKQDWVWKPWVPQGGYTLIGGEEGAGKTFLALTFLRLVIDNDPLPDGTYPEKTGKVVLAETEGKLQEALLRLDEWEVDLSKVIVPSKTSLDLLSQDGWWELEQAISQEGVELAVIDSISGAIMRENDPEVKEVSLRLSLMAQQYGIAIVGTHHLSKPIKGEHRYEIITRDFRGHGGITQFASSLIGVQHPNPYLPDRRVSNVKNNLEAIEDDFGFEIDDNGEVRFPDAPEFPLKQTKSDIAAEFLRDILANGPMLIRDVKKKASLAGIKVSTLRAVKTEIGVEHYKEGMKDYYWKLDE